MNPKEETWETECGPEDTLYTFVYEIEPYDPGIYTLSNGDPGYPPSGGYATVTEVRLPDGTVLDEDKYAEAGIDIKKIEERIYESWSEDQSDDDDGDHAYDAWKDRQSEKD